MEETNKDRIMRSILASERLAALGDYNPTDFDTIEDVEGTKRSVYLRKSQKMMEEPRIEIVR